MKTETNRKLWSILFPERCPYCRDVVRPCEIYCEECKVKMPEHTYKKKIRGVYEALSIAPYDDIFADAILRLKAQKREQYAYQLAKFMAQKLREEFGILNFDIITFVPLHPQDHEKRGFNQCELLAINMSKELNIPCEALIKKTRKNKPQHNLPASERQKNVEGVFRPVDKNRIKSKRILLIDDIVTTGSTLGECAKILEENGALEIYCMTFATSLLKTT